jgi:hypothetical protein
MSVSGAAFGMTWELDCNAAVATGKPKLSISLQSSFSFSLSPRLAHPFPPRF